MMKHTDDVSKAIRLLKQTLPEMNKRQIASTPNNYAVWYEFVAGENKALVAAINALDEKKTQYTKEVLQTLYNEHISDAHEAAVNQLSDSVKQVIHDVLSKISQEEHGLSDYAQTLADFSERAEHIAHLDDIKDLVLNLIGETKKREEATLSMQTSLESMALEMKKLRAEVAKINSEAITDSLTKVNNRRAFDTDVENFMNASKANTKPLCLVMVNIDHFKIFNDKFGHSIGDKVLRFVASLIKNNIKGRDSVARYGGDQFTILLPETNYEGALILAESLRDKLAKQTLSDSAEKIELGTITASFGVSIFQTSESSEQFIRKTEIALKQAKDSGRNQVTGNNQDLSRGPEVLRTVL
ncbi:MAG: GGDEF domain-containing protein [Oleiphilus sp.]